MGGGCLYVCKITKLDKELMSGSSSEEESGDLVSCDVFDFIYFEYKLKSYTFEHLTQYYTLIVL